MSEVQNKISQKPCPICQKMMFVTGIDNKGKKITSCGHKFSFKKTKSQKMMDRRYVETPWGLEVRNGN